MNNIPVQLIQMIKGGNPQQVAMNLLQQNLNNPMAENALNMINNGDSKGIETICRNICKSRNINIDELMKNVKNQFG